MSKNSWVKKEVYDYVVDVGNNISDVKRELREATEEKFPDHSRMLSTLDQGELMKMMVQTSGSRKGMYLSFLKYNYKL